MAEVTLILPPTDHDPFESAEARRQRIRRKQRLARAAKDPRLALERGWHHDPKLTAGLLDCAEQRAFLCAPDALETARRLVEVADRSGDPHLYNRSAGVMACAFMATGCWKSIPTRPSASSGSSAARSSPRCPTGSTSGFSSENR